METALVPGRKKRSYNKDELEIRELIKDKVHIWSYAKLAKHVNEVQERPKGKRVQAKRISAIVKRMNYDSEDHFTDIFLSGKKAAYESYMQYHRLTEEGWKLLQEADDIGKLVRNSEQEMAKENNRSEHIHTAKLKAKEKMMQYKALALEKIRLGEDQKDKLLKMAGVYQERAPSSLSDSEQWKNIQSAIMTYLQYVIVCPNCGHQGGSPVENFIEFIDAVGKDPSMLDVYLKKSVAKSAAYAEYKEEAKEFMEAEYE